MNKHTRSVNLIDGHTEEMTDAEVIKALECLAYHKECPESEECQYYMDNRNICDNVSLAKDALDLINRQKAEIERATTVLLKKEDTMQLLHNEHQNTFDELQKAKAEIERLTEERDFYKAPSSLLAKGIEQIKSEAIKDFAERLKANSIWVDMVSFTKIDNLVKEMTEVEGCKPLKRPPQSWCYVEEVKADDKQ